MTGTPDPGDAARRRSGSAPQRPAHSAWSPRRLAGYGLLALCAIAWAAIALLPFAGVTLGEGAALATVLIVVGEGAFVLGVILLGRDIVARLRALIDRLRDKDR